MSDTLEQMTHKLAAALAEIHAVRDKLDDMYGDEWLTLFKCQDRACDMVKAVKDELEKLRSYDSGFFTKHAEEDWVHGGFDTVEEVSEWAYHSGRDNYTIHHGRLVIGPAVGKGAKL